MDVPYNKSGASSRAHYQLVRNVENAPHQSEHLLLQEVERVRRRIAGRMLSTAELRKDLIVLLYCLNSSFGSVNSVTLAFALPSAVHLAEAGSRVSEKRIGYLFCSEVMPQEHELQLMLVNTIRKDLTSSSSARINLALESLVNAPSEDVVPAVHTRCVELLSHPSARIRILAMNALHALSRFVPDLLNDENVKLLILKRLSDSDESVVRAALKLGLSMVESKSYEGEKIMRPSIYLVSRFSDKHTTRNYSSAFSVTSLNTVAKLYEKGDPILKTNYANELLPFLLNLLRRSIKHDQQAAILECFHFLGRFPPTTVAQHIIKMSSRPAEPHQLGGGSQEPQPQFVHPVARIRHFLSSRTINDHYLFLSCLACLDPSLWAGTPQPSGEILSPTVGEQPTERDEILTVEIRPVLDQWEVERVLSFLESEDEQIRALTLRILISLDPSLVENCYTRALGALRAFGPSSSSSDHTRKIVLQRSLELAFTITLGNKKLEEASVGRVFIQKVREVTEAADSNDRVDGMIVESVLSRIRKEHTLVQRTCILSLLSLLQTAEAQEQSDVKSLDATLFLTLIALTCELASIFASSKSDVVRVICLFATVLRSSPISMQEPTLLCMTRLVALLSSTDIPSQEMENVRRVVHGLGEASLNDKKRVLVLKRCEQFAKVWTDPHFVTELLGNNQDVSLPEFALLLDQVDHRSSSAGDNPAKKPFPPPARLTAPVLSQSDLSALPQSKLRYNAYAPPPTASANRLVRAHSHSSAASGRSSNRASSRASSSRPGEQDADAELSETVTAGELTLAAGARTEFTRVYRGKLKNGNAPEGEQTITNIAKSDIPANSSSNLLALDSPFLAEPLVDVSGHAPATPPSSSPYVSASTSLRTSPEPGASFEELWSALAANVDAFSARGWCDDAADVAVRRLQSMGYRMDVLPADVLPFEGDLKISLHFTSLGALDHHLPCALLRLHEEGDGSCLWQVRCTDKELGVKVKELMK